MEIKKATLLELKQILKEEFGFDIAGKELEKFASSLLSYFNLLIKINTRQDVRKSSA